MTKPKKKVWLVENGVTFSMRWNEERDKDEPLHYYDLVVDGKGHLWIYDQSCECLTSEKCNEYIPAVIVR